MSEPVLNAQQLKAVRHQTGPLLIIAGAGTGKTTVITQRVKHLITEKLAQPEEILALTFTEKTAAQMQERVDLALPLGYAQMWITTFHSFCDRVLRDEGLHIGLNTGYKLISETDRIDLLRRHIFNLNLDYFRPLGNPNKFIWALLTHFDRLRDEDVNPDQYQKYLDTNNSDQTKELVATYQYFQKLKLEKNFMDFADLIFYTLKLFRDRPKILSIYQQKFKHILVDEFQDTNYAQNQLVMLLAGKTANLTVVADDDQAIYSWRGAAVANVLQFKKHYPKTKIVVLTQNYRSPQAILDAAYKLIQFNNPDRLEVAEKIDKHLISNLTKPGAKPEYLHFSRVDQEADGVAKKIQELLANDPDLSPKDIAILVRANAHSKPFINSLKHLGIPHQFLGPSKLFDQPEIKDLISYLQLLVDPSDNQAAYRVMSMDIWHIPQTVLLKLTHLAKLNNTSLISIKDASIDKFISIFENNLSQTKKSTAGEVLFSFLKDSGLLALVLNPAPPLDPVKAENITKFFNRVKEFESLSTDTSATAVLDWLMLSSEVGDSPSASNADWQETDAVNILTVHSAKGLEFPVVFVANLVSGRFPTTEKKEPILVPEELIKEQEPVGDYHLQEERRLCYVAMTRAKSKLFLTAADYYGEGKRLKKLSPFISEALGDDLLKLSSSPALQLSLNDWQPPEHSVRLNADNQRLTTKVNYLSYSQIQTFLDCPLHYQAKYILKIATPTSAASSFGNTIHQTLKSYYQQLQRQSHPDIIQLFRQHWSPQGYHNARHAQLYFAKGQKYLLAFLDQPLSHIIPAKIEEPFTIPLSPDLKIGGKIDRVDVLPDGGIEIIDYKTTTKPLTTKEAQDNLQLSFYALAASLLPHKPFHLQPEKIKLTLYYLDQQTSVSVYQTSDQLAAAKQQILDYKNQIENSDFHCSNSIICQGKCDYSLLCGEE